MVLELVAHVARDAGLPRQRLSSPSDVARREVRNVGVVLQKDIQYASRAESHIERQNQLHRLRHVIRELALRLPEAERSSPEIEALAAWGCGTMMHVVKLNAPRLEGDDHTKDIDFTPAGIRSRWQAGHADAARIIAAEPWLKAVDPIEGVLIHQADTAGL